MRLTKIVATVGPATESPQTVEQLIRAGVDVFRLNCAHGSRETLSRYVAHIRSASEKLDRPVAVLADLAGPKIRVGAVEGGRVTLRTGSEVEIVPGNEVGTAARLSTTYAGLVGDVEPGSRVLLDDGLMELVVKERRGRSVLCRVVAGGELGSHKGINLPGVDISAPTVTDEDRVFVDWAVSSDIDFLGISFVRRVDDVRELRTILHERESSIRVIAKIEKPEAVDDLEEIVELADGIMVARGDLGVEMPLEEVPMLQKRIISLCRELLKPVITATEMLESMIRNPRPTRAEVGDVANAILDGSDAVMLSGETAVGKYPVAAVAVMDRVARKTEQFLAEHPPSVRSADYDPARPVASALSEGVYHVSRLLESEVVAVSSASGDTALLLAKERMSAPIVGVSGDRKTVRRMCLYYGVRPVHAEKLASLDDLFAVAEKTAVEEGLAGPGDEILLVAGDPFGVSGTTNTLQVRRVRLQASPKHEKVRSWQIERSEGVFCYEIRVEDCITCGVCVNRCPAGVWVIAGGSAVVDEARLQACTLDEACVRECPTGAIRISWSDVGERAGTEGSRNEG